MAAKWAGRKGRAWRLLCNEVYADPNETHCIRCGRPVDKELVFSPTLPPEVRRWARSVDHIVAIHQGGPKLSRDNVGVAHYVCNSRHGARTRWSSAAPAPTRLIVDVDPRSL